MLAWWIGVVAYLVLVVPVVVLLLHRTVRRALAMRRAAERLAERGEALAARMEELRELRRTPELVDEVKVGMARYGQALEELR